MMNEHFVFKGNIVKLYEASASLLRGNRIRGDGNWDFFACYDPKEFFECAMVVPHNTIAKWKLEMALA
jgi:hypothetical protein